MAFPWPGVTHLFRRQAERTGVQTTYSILFYRWVGGSEEVQTKSEVYSFFLF